MNEEKQHSTYQREEPKMYALERLAEKQYEELVAIREELQKINEYVDLKKWEALNYIEMQQALPSKDFKFSFMSKWLKDKI